jgi:hypothetical protein
MCILSSLHYRRVKPYGAEYDGGMSRSAVTTQKVSPTVLGIALGWPGSMLMFYVNSVQCIHILLFSLEIYSIGLFNKFRVVFCSVFIIQ